MLLYPIYTVSLFVRYKIVHLTSICNGELVGFHTFIVPSGSLLYFGLGFISSLPNLFGIKGFSVVCCFKKTGIYFTICAVQKT
jgi:hypothetical protein